MNVENSHLKLSLVCWLALSPPIYPLLTGASFSTNRSPIYRNDSNLRASDSKTFLSKKRLSNANNVNVQVSKKGKLQEYTIVRI